MDTLEGVYSPHRRCSLFLAYPNGLTRGPALPFRRTGGLSEGVSGMCHFTSHPCRSTCGIRSTSRSWPPTLTTISQRGPSLIAAARPAPHRMLGIRPAHAAPAQHSGMPAAKAGRLATDFLVLLADGQGTWEDSPTDRPCGSVLHSGQCVHQLVHQLRRLDRASASRASQR